jgi:hypothetical protein
MRSLPSYFVYEQMNMKNTYVKKENSLESEKLCCRKTSLPVEQEKKNSLKS